MEGGRFVGELVVIRQSQDAAENTLAFLLESVQAHARWSQRTHAQARILVCSTDGIALCSSDEWASALSGS